MSFLHHEPCPRCGSRDNLARFTDGGAWCFGCHYSEHPTRYIPKQEIIKEYQAVPKLTTDFSKECVEWVAKYNVSLEELLKRGVGWNAERSQLVFTFDGGVWQARNFGGAGHGNTPRSKYFTQGNVNDVIPIYASPKGSTCLVLVEDCISAIKVGRHYDSMPLLGSHIGYPKLLAISKLYPEVIFWLDADKFKEAQGLSQRAKLLGMQSRVLFTEVDPKEIDDVAIKQLVEAT